MPENKDGADRMDLFSPSAKPLNTPQASTAATNPGSRSIYSGSNRFISRLSRRRVLPFAVAAVVLVTIGTLVTAFQINKRLQSANDQADNAALAELPASSLGELPQVLADSTLSSSRVSINGPLDINNSLTITPSSQPQNAKAGQIYFDSETRSFAFYDGTNFQTVSTAQGLGVLQGMIEGQQAQNAALIEDRINTGIGIIFAQLQDAQDVELIELEAGEGIDITSNRVTNTGVTRLQGTPNQINLSANTGDITISLPQDIDDEATPVFAGLTVNDLTVLTAADINELSLTAALGISSGGSGTDGSDYSANGVLYYDGSRFATASASGGGQCFVSSLGAPQFVPCNTIDFDVVRSLNGLSGNISIHNADAAGSTITIRDATTTSSGLLSATNQRIAGLKTFTGGIELNNNGAITSGGSFSLQPANNQDLTIATSGNGDIILSNFNCTLHGNGGKLTVDSNGVLQCAEDTGGDGVGLTSIQPADPSVTVDVTDGSNPAVAVNINSSGGLEVTQDGVGLLGSCTDEQVLKYDQASSSWTCSDDIGEDNTDDPCPTCVVLQDETPGTPQEGNISITGTLAAGGADIAGHTTISGNALIRTASDSEDAFMVQNAIGSELVKADTSHMSVTIGSLASPTTPKIGGDSLPSTPVGSLGTGHEGSFSSVSEPKAVAVKGNYSYTAIATRNVVQIADISNPESPTFEVELGIGANSNPSDVVTYGDYLYVLARGTSQVRVYDISEEPMLTSNVANVSIQGAAESMTLHNNYLFIASGNSRLQILDVSNPASPSLKYTVITSSASDGVAIKDNYAYVTQWSGNQIEIFDISDIQNSAPTSVGTVSTNSGPRRIAISGDHAYVVNSTAGSLQTFDISNPASPQAVDSTGTGAHPYSVHATGNVVLVASYSGKSLQVFTLNDPADPELAGSIPTSRSAIYVTFAQGHAFVTGANNGLNGILEIFNLGGSAETLTVYGGTSIVGRIAATSAEFGGNVAVGGLSANTTVQANTAIYTPMIDTIIAGALQLGNTNATAINLNQDTTIGVGKTLAVQGETTITADAANALLIKDGDDNSYLHVDTSSKNISIGTLSAPSGGNSGGGELPTDYESTTAVNMLPRDMEIDGDHLYVANWLTNHIEVFDISDPHSPSRTGGTTGGPGFPGGEPNIMAVADGYAYMLFGTNLVQIFDVTNPANPSAVTTLTVTGSAFIYSIEVSGNYAYVTYRNVSSTSSNENYLAVVDISDKSNPSIIHTQFIGFNSTYVFIDIDGTDLYIVKKSSSANFSELRVLDISDPDGGNLPSRNVVQLSNVGVGTAPEMIAAKNGYVYIPISSTSRMHIFDATDPSVAPAPLGSVAISGSPTDIKVSDSGKFVYIVDGIANTIRLINVSDPENPANIGTVATGGQAAAIAVAGGNVYALSGQDNSFRSYDFGSGSEAPAISLNQNTVIASGKSLSVQGDTAVKTTSSSAFAIQNASGDNLLVADTENGIVTLNGDMQISTDSASALVVQSAGGDALLSVDTADKTITFGAVATFQASIIVNGHIITGGETPAIVALAAAGTGGSCEVSGNDISGTITVTVGASGSGTGDLCELTFDQAFSSTPRPIISGADSSSSALGAYAKATTDKLTLGTSGTPSAEAEYEFNYWNPQ